MLEDEISMSWLDACQRNSTDSHLAAHPVGSENNERIGRDE